MSVENSDEQRRTDPEFQRTERGVDEDFPADVEEEPQVGIGTDGSISRRADQDEGGTVGVGTDGSITPADERGERVDVDPSDSVGR